MNKHANELILASNSNSAGYCHYGSQQTASHLVQLSITLSRSTKKRFMCHSRAYSKPAETVGSKSHCHDKYQTYLTQGHGISSCAYIIRVY